MSVWGSGFTVDGFRVWAPEVKNHVVECRALPPAHKKQFIYTYLYLYIYIYMSSKTFAEGGGPTVRGEFRTQGRRYPAVVCVPGIVPRTTL